MQSTHQVKALRLQRAWSQEQLAELASLSVRTIQRIENGEAPSLETLSALAAVFGVSVTELSAESVVADDSLDRRIVDARLRVKQEARFYHSLVSAVIICLLLWGVNYLTSPGNYWVIWVALIWGSLLVIRGLRLFMFGEITEKWRKARLQKILRK